MRNSNILYLLIVVFGLGLTACDSNAKSDVDELTTEVKDDAKKMGEKMEAKMKADKNTTETSTIVKGKDIFNLTQVDMPPLFDVDCLTESDPSKCSEKKLYSFIKDNIEVPSEIKRGNAESLEQVIVVINEDGSISNLKYIASSDNESCKTCQQAAADVVGKMNNWKPAMKDGKPVSVQMTIPIKFNS